jgi:hypothetical protein
MGHAKMGGEDAKMRAPEIPFCHYLLSYQALRRCQQFVQSVEHFVKERHPGRLADPRHAPVSGREVLDYPASRSFLRQPYVTIARRFFIILIYERDVPSQREAKKPTLHLGSLTQVALLA